MNSLLHALVISLCTVDDYRVFLITPVVGRNDYINAVFASVSVALGRLNIMALVQHKENAKKNLSNTVYKYVRKETHDLFQVHYSLFLL